MMRDCSSVRLIWSAGSGPSTGGWGGLPQGFRPVAAALASRAASLASYSACSRSKRSWARASILARASASFASRSSRRANSSGIDRPSGRSARSAASALASNSATFSCASILPACSYDSALCRLALAWILVPSRAHLEHAHLARHRQHLDEQPLDLLEKPSPERGDRVVIGMLVG